MKADKNLHAKIQPGQLAELEKAAQADAKELDDVVHEAVEGYLRTRRREKLYAYGEAQARKLRLKPSDVPRLIDEVRREDKERGR